MNLPANIHYGETSRLFNGITDTMMSFARALTDAGYRFYVCKVDRGHAYYDTKLIIIPLWVVINGERGADLSRPVQTRKELQDYKNWYLSHEMAHPYTVGDHHGPKFMKQLKIICPAESLKYELTYKPRNAFNAGIRCFDF